MSTATVVRRELRCAQKVTVRDPQEAFFTVGCPCCTCYLRHRVRQSDRAAAQPAGPPGSQFAIHQSGRQPPLGPALHAGHWQRSLQRAGVLHLHPRRRPGPAMVRQPTADGQGGRGGRRVAGASTTSAASTAAVLR